MEGQELNNTQDVTNTAELTNKTELTNTQLYMIEQIEKAIKNEEELLEKASYEDKTQHRIRLSQLYKQLEGAKQPFTRSDEEKEMIDEIVENVKDNIEVNAGTEEKKEGKMTSKEEFEYGMSQYINEVKFRKEELEKTLIVQEGILEVLGKIEAIGDVAIYNEELKGRQNIVNQIKMSIEAFTDRLNMSDEVQRWALDNYENISKLNIYLNNPLRLKDYEEYETKLKEKYTGEKNGN